MSKPRPLPPLREFEERFKRKFGRDLTEVERCFWYLAEEVLEQQQDGPPPDDETGKGASASKR